MMGLLKSKNYSGGLVALTLLVSCSSHIPPEIKQPLDGGSGVAQVRQKIDDYLTQKVRWGGIILQTENKQNTTEITVMALPLNDDGEPQSSDQSPGRFIAIIDEFLEPLVYSPEREITVTGHILKTETIEVGEFPYEYPVIQVDHYYL